MKVRELELLKRLVGDWNADLSARMPDGTSLQGKELYERANYRWAGASGLR